MNKVIAVVALLGMLAGASLLTGCDPQASRAHQYNDECNRMPTSEEIRAMRQRGENVMDACR